MRRENTFKVKPCVSKKPHKRSYYSPWHRPKEKNKANKTKKGKKNVARVPVPATIILKFAVLVFFKNEILKFIDNSTCRCYIQDAENSFKLMPQVKNYLGCCII